MPERSFGRTVRYRRTQLGLSQAKLAELVGRSTPTIRSWERDKSRPNDPQVLSALAAILGVDERQLFDKAEVAPPTVETSPTVEQALASLSFEPPLMEHQAEPPEGRLGAEEPRIEITPEPGPLLEDEVSANADSTTTEPESDLEEQIIPVDIRIEVTPELGPLGEPDEPTPEPEVPVPDEAQIVTSVDPELEDDQLDEDEGEAADRELELVGGHTPAYVAPPEPYAQTPLTPTLADVSYMEDQSQRQMYRVRSLATLVAVVVLVIAFVWALGEGLGALGEWWDDFFGNLRV